jgi:hypothetical protein
MTHFLRCTLGHSKPCQSSFWAAQNNFKIKTCAACHHAFIADDLSDDDLAQHYSYNENYNEGYEDDLRKQCFLGSRSDAIRYLSLIQSALPVSRRPIAFL